MELTRIRKKLNIDLVLLTLEIVLELDVLQDEIKTVKDKLVFCYQLRLANVKTYVPSIAIQFQLFNIYAIHHIFTIIIMTSHTGS